MRNDAIYTFTSVGTSGGGAEVQAAFEEMVSTLTFASTDPTGPGATNPLVTPPTSDERNPLAAVDPFVGTFAGDGLTLTLEGSAGSYDGHLTSGDQTFPVTANLDGGVLSGTFVSAGTPFAFTATITDGRMDLESGGARYVLDR